MPGFERLDPPLSLAKVGPSAASLAACAPWRASPAASALLLLGGGGLLRRGEELTGCPARIVATRAWWRASLAIARAVLRSSIAPAARSRARCAAPRRARAALVSALPGPCPVAGRPPLCLLGLRLGLALCRLGLAGPLLAGQGVPGLPGQLQQGGDSGGLTRRAVGG